MSALREALDALALCVTNAETAAENAGNDICPAGCPKPQAHSTLLHAPHWPGVKEARTVLSKYRTQSMMHPSVHLNGTSKQSLLDVYTGAGSALDGAMRALGECAPNGRDYYPQGPDALKQAIREHEARIADLETVRREVAQIVNQLEGFFECPQCGQHITDGKPCGCGAR